MVIQIYDSRVRAVRDFIPARDGKVSIYVCGPTVYQLLHVGNFRGAIFFNLVRNWLEFRGYAVKFVYNYTDVDDFSSPLMAAFGFCLRLFLAGFVVT